jgi:glucose/mannose transport system substrate-binding protein
MATSLTDRVSVVHDWQSGDGEDAIEGLYEVFRKQHPDVDIDTQLTDSVRFKVKTDLLKQDPPDVWFDWPGANLAPYLDTGVLADITDLWSDNDLEAAYLDGPASLSRFDGRYYAVPLNIHRINNLFYNVPLVEEAGVDPTAADSPREFISILEQVEDLDAMGLIQPMKNPWPTVQLWATVLLGQTGVDTYTEIVEGDARLNSGAIETTLELLARYMEFTTDETLFYDITDAHSRFAQGESVFYSMGDWAVSTFEDKSGYDYREDWNSVPFPGSEGLYPTNMDAAISSGFGEQSESVTAFLETAASVEGQVAFNKSKGSIPPRTDVPEREFTDFQRDQMEAFQRSQAQPPSIAHGLAVTPEQRIELLSTFAEFANETDVDSTASELVRIFEDT